MAHRTEALLPLEHQGGRVDDLHSSTASTGWSRRALGGHLEVPRCGVEEPGIGLSQEWSSAKAGEDRASLRQ